MDSPTAKRLAFVAAVILIMLMSAGGCSPSARSAAGTLAAPLQQTLQSSLMTRAASGMQTSAVEIPTLVIEAGKTGVARAQTQAPIYLTPERPSTGYQLHREDIIVFPVRQPVRVHEAAYRFSTPVDYLIQLNQARYPSITGPESRLERGWTIIIFAGTSGRTDLVPYAPDAWNVFEGCGGQPSPDGITCGAMGLDYVSEKGRLRPECLPNTAAGEYSINSSVTGQILSLNGQPFLYGVYWDAARNMVLMGPALIQESSDETQCG
jgi:hypothetical protein